MNKRKTQKYIYAHVVNFESDVYDGEVLDTEVCIGDKFLMCITGESIDAFTKDLKELFEKYAI